MSNSSIEKIAQNVMKHTLNNFGAVNVFFPKLHLTLWDFLGFTPQYSFKIQTNYGLGGERYTQ